MMNAWAFIGPLTGIAMGWALKVGTDYFLRRASRKAKLSNAISSLLILRQKVHPPIPAILERMEAKLPPSAHSGIRLWTYETSSHWTKPISIKLDVLHEAASELAGSDPWLASEILTIEPLIQSQASSMNMLEGKPANLMPPELADVSFSRDVKAAMRAAANQFCADLIDAVVLKIAKEHSRGMEKKVVRLLAKADKIPEEYIEICTKFIETVVTIGERV